MASMTPGLAAGTADGTANTYAADASATILDNAKAQTNLQKGGRSQSVSITNG